MCPQAQRGEFRMDSLEQSMQLVFQLSSTANQFLGLSRKGAQAWPRTFSRTLRIGLDSSKAQIVGHEPSANPVCLARVQALLFGKSAQD